MDVSEPDACGGIQPEGEPTSAARAALLRFHPEALLSLKRRYVARSIAR
jgi:hypothetical protein